MFGRSAIMAVAALGLGIASAQTTSSIITRTTTVPPFGLGSTETARVTVVNTASNSTSGTASCSGSIAFLNSGGAAIGTATTFTVGAGQLASASLPFASSGLTGVRGDIRASVTLNFSSTAPLPCSLQISVATFDTSSGATHLYLNGGEASTPLPLGLGLGHH